MKQAHVAVKSFALNSEFNRIGAMKWNLRLALGAWILFVVSFFLPATNDARGWQCAGQAACFAFDAYHHLLTDFKPCFQQLWSQSDIGGFHLASLTFANLIMLASPFLFLKASRNVSTWWWQLLCNFAAFGLVGTFFVLLDKYEIRRSELRIGYYAWTISFLLLFLSSALRSREPNPRAIAAN